MWLFFLCYRRSPFDKSTENSCKVQQDTLSHLDHQNYIRVLFFMVHAMIRVGERMRVYIESLLVSKSPGEIQFLL